MEQREDSNKAMVSHFTYGVAYLWCVAYLLWVDKITGTYNVRNAYSTLERHQCILELKNKQVCHDLQVDFPLPLVILSYCSILNCSKLVWSISNLFCSSSMSLFKTGIWSTWFLMGVNKFGILNDVFVSTFWITDLNASRLFLMPTSVADIYAMVSPCLSTLSINEWIRMDWLSLMVPLSCWFLQSIWFLNLFSMFCPTYTRII